MNELAYRFTLRCRLADSFVDSRRENPVHAVCYLVAHGRNSKFVLSSGFDEIDPNSGAETKDTDENLAVTLNSAGGVLTITGFSGKKWNELPDVVVTR